MFRLAPRAQDPALLLSSPSRRCRRISFHLGGECIAAGNPFRAQSMALYDPQQHHTFTFVYGAMILR